MRKLTSRLLICALTTVSVTGFVERVHAGSRESGGQINVTLSLSGFATPSKHWANPCEDGEPYTSYASHETYIKYYKDEATDIEISNGGFGPDHGDELIAIYGDDVFENYVRTHTRFMRYCYDPTDDTIQPGAIDYFWVPLVTQQTVVAALWRHVWDYVEAPSVRWPSIDQDFGWLYVRAPMDFRIQDVPAVSVTATVTNITGTVTATVTATPSELLLEPGEPGGFPASCPISESTASYLVSTPGSCSIMYQNSSAISASGTFEANASVLWTIETTDPGFGVSAIRTWSWFDVAVAEAQAVVTG
jgi:hypothetical protein